MFSFSSRQNFAFPLLALVLGAITTSLSAQEPQKKIGEVYASDAKVEGSVILSSGVMSIGNGSSVTATDHAASIRLARGGEVRVCPGTSLSIHSPAKSNDLMLGMSTGAIEGDYPLPASADVVMTPDFRILLSGPGRARISITSNARGDTCIRSLGEESYVIVTELLGDATYRVKPNEQVFFPRAQIAQATTDSPMACGCPVAAPVKQAEVEQRKMKTEAADNKALLPLLATSDPEKPLPPSRPGEVNVEVDAPFIFHGNETAPDVTVTLARVHMEKIPDVPMPAVNPLPPLPSQTMPVKVASAEDKPLGQKTKGFFHKIGSFFVAMFKG